MVNKVHKVFILSMMILLLSSLVSANWVTYSRDSANTNYQPFGEGYYSFNETDVTLDKTTDINYLTEIRPLALDVDDDGLEEIFVYDDSTGKINVLNLDANDNLNKLADYTFPQVNEAVITVNEDGDYIYVAKSVSEITALTYSNGVLTEYKTLADANAMSSELLCALQGATSVPICYYFDSSNYLRAWNINGNNMTVSNVTITHSNNYLLADLDLDTIKDIYTYTGRTLKKIEGLDVSNITAVTVSTSHSSDLITGIASVSATSFAFTWTEPSFGRDDYVQVRNANLGVVGTSQICSYASVPGSHPVSLGVIKYNGINQYYANCQGNQGTAGYVVGTTGSTVQNIGYVPINNIATGNLLDGYTNSSEFIIGSNFYYINQTDGTKDVLTVPYTLSDKYIISDFNGNGFNDIIETTLTGLNIYTSVAITPPTSGQTITFVSGNDYSGFYNFYGSGKVCTESTVIFSSNRCLTTSTSSECSYTYDGNDRQRAVANVNGNLIYGDWTYQGGDFTLNVPVTFTLAGSYNVVLYVQSEDKPEDFSKTTGQFIMTVSGDQQGINCNVASNFLNTPQKSDGSKYSNEGLDGIFDILLGGNTKTKMIIGIGLTLGILIGVAGVTTNWLVLLLTFIMAIIMNTMFGLFPAWIIVLIILIAILIMVFKGTLSKGNGDGE